MASRSDAYKAAGVNIDAANDFIGRIKGMVGSTFTKGVVTDIGGFGGLFKLDLTQMEEPVLVAGTDGVGTKLKLAFALDKHDTIGIDLVAMSVNDILVQGAKPLFFLDYFATGKLEVGVAETVLSGIVEGCKMSSCALLGGETAEMPGFYADGEYDLSGFCVGMVDNANIVDGSSITIGDSIIGLASSGVHSNGYSLVRKLYDESGLAADDLLPGTDQKIGEALITPTKIYADAVRNIIREIEVKGMVHVTGGGFYDNLPRILPQQVTAEINFGTWEVLPVFNWMKEQGNLSWPEMLQIFNCGIGYIMVVKGDREEDVINRLNGMDIKSWKIGEITARDGDSEQVNVNF
ncbi:phosphoribosylformylglycinamidine cyclo-ligase [Maridesulfovibrio ferrireducens]|uniref:Phosphoribosylformylglycinamidine cyclo-ligase n=1 Tax=Maridesulfovibrio ferrireducens TaxID=246191 RepID=A0A1G9IYX7_9BACT|nr:phosphoribosylformylglycinamidine cyclo-ligase [Maridesulfovibrio ferrireducens]MBI9112526.1 phosphoribosylformylglycinamidine cyclo-ligase [Maridesulfovibrio ferrireducens]SDL30467.1 phosphoribosylformylglycinamidine cyclo-ligase [Maridesulfovibrio ferrireducens]